MPTLRSSIVPSLLLTVCAVARAATAGEPLAGTQPLTVEGDLASAMVEGIDRFLLRQIEQAPEHRAAFWDRDTSSPEKYNASVQPNRERLAKIIGAVDRRLPCDELEIIATTSQPALVGGSLKFEALAVRWPVLPGVYGEGLLLHPTRETPIADVIAIPDADQTPEMIAGLVTGDKALPAEQQFARRLAESGCRVVVPVLIDRDNKYSVGAAGTRPTNQPHREFIYRQAYELGRHIIGYEVQKMLALVDFFAADAKRNEQKRPIGIMGYAEGGLIAFNTAALDTRVDVACVSGYFGPRDRVWEEPIYRNVFSLLREFGDAEIASLIAPRALVIEASRVPEIAGPPKPAQGVGGGAAPGKLTQIDPLASTREALRVAKLPAAMHGPLTFMGGPGADNVLPAGSESTLEAFLHYLNKDAEVAELGPAPVVRRQPDPQRLKRQFDELVDFTQDLLAQSEETRRQFWSKASRRSIEEWQESTAWYRKYFYDQVIGRFVVPKEPANPRTRKIFDQPEFTGYEVMLDVFPDVFAYGILLVPKDLKPGERRPVVVCQHGLEGRPQAVADPSVNDHHYNQYAIQLVKRGYVTYAPQNPYIFQDRFRVLQRMANPLGRTLFSIIVPQHEQTVDWLASLDFVDPKRIAFYGLSYGGKTAMRVPSIVEKYCLSICSADFNEWIWKNTSARSPYSYLHTGEYEMFEFDLGNTFNYSDMAGLIAPRPFMVERGHRDGVAPDDTVAYEYAKVRLLYADLKIPERTTIEFFDGPHTIHGVGTFEFLDEQLGWTPTSK
ncbi:MAG TPA: dienelactone hydrolase family protein [Pirellulales bacterium]|nr:dienelactone hydrolase family protein [Pirellulales bacterium]